LLDGKKELEQRVAQRDEEIRAVQSQIEAMSCAQIYDSQEMHRLREQCNVLQQQLNLATEEVRVIEERKNLEIQQTIDTYVSYYQQAEKRVVELEGIVAEKEKYLSASEAFTAAAEEEPNFFVQREVMAPLGAVSGQDVIVKLESQLAEKIDLINKLETRVFELQQEMTKLNEEAKESSARAVDGESDFNL